MANIKGVEVKLRPEVKKKWLKALRSGKYKQTGNQLVEINDDNKPVAFCCLGVLCDVHRQSRRQKGDKWDGNSYHGADALLPEKVINWAFTASSLAALEAEHGDAVDALEDPNILGTTLSTYNDNRRYSFKEIADVIAENL